MIEDHTIRDSFHKEIESLADNRIDPRFLYVTPRQAELWRQVFLKHSPVNGNADFVRIYREAFEQIQKQMRAEKVFLVGLGCGTGAKELELYLALKSRGHAAKFAAIDVSEDLVVESRDKLTKAGAEHRSSLVCDLGQTDILKDWLNRQSGLLPRLITFFGLVPNLMPSAAGRIFRAVLRPGDVLLVSAHLAPIRQEGVEGLARAMKEVLPQYDNVETLAWIAEGLKEWQLTDRVEVPEMTIGELEGIPAFLAQARWKTEEPFERWRHRFKPRIEAPLKCFYSLRYTPELFEDFLRREGFEFEFLAMTACRQEAIWAVRPAQK